MRRRKKISVNYSESFIFRARCRFCGSIPIYSTSSINGVYRWKDNKLFQNVAKKKSFTSTNEFINTFSSDWALSKDRFFHGNFKSRIYYKAMSCKAMSCLKSNNDQYHTIEYNGLSHVFSMRGKGGAYCKCHQSYWSFENYNAGCIWKRSKKFTSGQGD